MLLLRHDSPSSTCVSRDPNFKTLADASVEARKSPHREKAMFLSNGSL
jgi:hypothetical protein